MIASADQIRSRPQTTDFPPNGGGLVREMGPRLFQGNPEKVKYYNWPRLLSLMGLAMHHRTPYISSYQILHSDGSIDGTSLFHCY